MFSENEIQKQIAFYVKGSQSFEDFEDWLVEQSRAHYLDNPQYIRDIVGQIRYLIFQRIENEINEDQLKKELVQFLNNQKEEFLIFAASASRGPIINLRFASEDHLVEFAVVCI